MGLLKSIFGGAPSEAEAYIERARQATGIPLTPSHVGLFRTLKIADEMPESREFGFLCAPATIMGLAGQVRAFEDDFGGNEISGRFISYFSNMYSSEGFRSEHLAQSMGESDLSTRTAIGKLTMDTLSVSPHVGGTDNELILNQIADVVARDPNAISNMTAWMAMGIARMSRSGRMPALSRINGWEVF